MRAWSWTENYPVDEIRDHSPQPALSMATEWVIEGEAQPSVTARRG